MPSRRKTGPDREHRQQIAPRMWATGVGPVPIVTPAAQRYRNVDSAGRGSKLRGLMFDAEYRIHHWILLRDDRASQTPRTSPREGGENAGLDRTASTPRFGVVRGGPDVTPAEVARP